MGRTSDSCTLWEGPQTTAHYEIDLRQLYTMEGPQTTVHYKKDLRQLYTMRRTSDTMYTLRWTSHNCILWQRPQIDHLRREGAYMKLLHCHHQNCVRITMGCDVIHFNVSLIVQGKVTRQ